ncbi:MAG: hypothetical protein ACJA2M_002661 [Polaribacter sp.]|jgi:hypothetical protein
MTKINYRKVNYEIKLINKTVNFLKGIIHKTYKITKVICKFGVVQKVTIGFVTVVVALGLRFGNLRPVEPIIQSQTQIERQLQHSRSTQPSQAMEVSKSSAVRNLLKLSGGDLGKGSSPGARARSAARKAITNRPKAAKSGSIFAEAWAPNTLKGSRPAAANRLAQQFQTGLVEGGNGLFGRFSARPTPDPYNPGCAGGPRSITVRPGQRNPNSSTEHSLREITAHDGVKGRLTDKSLNHLTSKHADALGIDDPLPPNPNQKPKAYKQTRTRVNKVNKRKFGDTVEKILEDPNTEVFPDISMRGIAGHGYYNEDYAESGFFVGIHNEGDFTGQIIKAQPISEAQLKVLQEKNKID